MTDTFVSFVSRANVPLINSSFSSNLPHKENVMPSSKSSTESILIEQSELPRAVNKRNDTSWLSAGESFPDVSGISASRTEKLDVLDSTSRGYTFFAVCTSTTDGSFIVPANNLFQKFIQQSNKIYDKAIEKCTSILSSLDLEDDVSRSIASQRLKDVLSIFSEISDFVISKVAEDFETNPEILGFLLAHVVVDVDEIAETLKAAIIGKFAHNQRAGVRYEAVRALDLIQSSVARPIFESMLPGEKNREVRALLAASLNRPA